VVRERIPTPELVKAPAERSWGRRNQNRANEMR
jgi:hypothetical protein